MDIIKNIIPENRANRPGFFMTPQYITIHNTGNPNATALAHGNYLSKNSIAERLPVSYHFTVDDLHIVQHLPLNESGWHTGDGTNGPGNRKSIGIEICEFTDTNRQLKAEENAYRLTAFLCNTLNISPDFVVQHHHWTRKNCPRVLRGRPGGWTFFITMVKKHLQLFTDVPNDYWNIDDLQWAKEKGIIKGSPDGSFKPDDSLTRAQAVSMIKNLYNAVIIEIGEKTGHKFDQTEG